jgi:hypothetical protein
VITKEINDQFRAEVEKVHQEFKNDFDEVYNVF